MKKRLISTAVLASALFSPGFASADAVWYDITFTGADIWTYSADNAAQAPIDQSAPRRYRDFTQASPIQATTYGVNGGTASTVANLGFGAWAPTSGFAFDEINLWGAGGPAAAAWGESYISLGNSDPLPGVSSWKVLQAPTGWTFGIVEGGQPYSADATHAFPVWRSGTGSPLGLSNMLDPSFVFEVQVLVDQIGGHTEDPLVCKPLCELRVFFGGFNDDLQGTGPDDHEVAGIMTLQAKEIPVPGTLALLGLGLAGLAMRRRRVAA